MEVNKDICVGCSKCERICPAGCIVMALYRPRTWCTFCSMGTMTQGICKIRNISK